MDPKDLRIGEHYKYGGRNVTLRWVSQCGRYAKVVYHMGGKERPVAVDALTKPERCKGGTR